jgi:hypothetical protein
MRRRFVSRAPGELQQPVDTAEVFLIDEVSVERVDVRWRERRPVADEHQVRRAQQLEERAAREVGRNRREDEIDGRRERLRGERQGVERLVGDPRVLEHLPRQIQIRKRPLEDDRRPPQRRLAAGL